MTRQKGKRSQEGGKGERAWWASIREAILVCAPLIKAPRRMTVFNLGELPMHSEEGARRGGGQASLGEARRGERLLRGQDKETNHQFCTLLERTSMGSPMVSQSAAKGGRETTRGQWGQAEISGHPFHSMRNRKKKEEEDNLLKPVLDPT